MSHLRIITSEQLAAGFWLAGASVRVAATARDAQEILAGWLDAGETGLVALDERLLAELDTAFRRRLEEASQLPVVGLPDGRVAERVRSRRAEIAEMLRRAIGFRLSFGEEEGGGGS